MSSFTQFVPTRMEVGDIAEATLMAIATAPDKRVALELLHTLCREHAISDSDISGGKTWDAAALALLTAGGGSLDGYILQAGDMRTARDDLHRRLPGDEYVNDRGNILLAISKRQ